MTLKVASYNCRGLPRHPSRLFERPCLSSILNDSDVDIICLQETWLAQQDLPVLKTLHNNYNGMGCTSISYEDGLIHGHPPGGVAILWKTSLENCINIIETHHSWFCCVQINCEAKSHIVICIYMPYEKRDHEELYLQNLGILCAFIDDLNCTSVQIIGDWNADSTNDKSLFGALVKDFCNENDFIISDSVILPPRSFSFVSDVWSTTSMLDHCVSSHDAHAAIECIQLGYNLSHGDHIPLFMNIKFDKLPMIDRNQSNNLAPKLRWNSLSTHLTNNYGAMTERMLSDLTLPHDAILCKDVCCNNIHHRESITKLYDDIKQVLLTCSSHLFHQFHGAERSRPGWCDYAKDYYDSAREFFVLWCDFGKPRQGPIYEMMKSSRARSKRAIRFIKRHQEDLRSESLARNLSSGNPNKFWSEIKKLNNSKISLPDSIDEARGAADITDFWKRQYYDLFNCLNRGRTETYEVSYSEDILVSITEIDDVLKGLKLGKSCGLDGIYSEHIVYASRRLRTLLALCFSAFFIHGTLPESMLDVILVPVIKDRSKKISCKDNYRPIALASVMSKVVELILLRRAQSWLSTECNQFGFKPEHGTDMCIYAIKEIIDRYQCLNGNVFMSFLDASKAFDRVSHTVLFNKLIDRGVPGYVIRILECWYNNQNMCVRWGGNLSEKFTVSNGVRQGGILSPYLFNIYMDDLSKLLNKIYAGCSVNGIIHNNLMYADDLVLFASSATALQSLLDKTYDYGCTHDINFNSKKSAILIVKNSYIKNIQSPKFCIGKESINEVDSLCYLGHILSSSGSDNDDLIRQCRKLYVQSNILARKFHMCSNDVKKLLFRSFCYPLYTSQLWRTFNQCKYYKLKVAYNNAFRSLMGYPRWCSASAMFVSEGILSFTELLRKFAYSFRNRLENSKNNIIRNIMTSDYWRFSKMRQHWHTILEAP